MDGEHTKPTSLVVLFSILVSLSLLTYCCFKLSNNASRPPTRNEHVTFDFSTETQKRECRDTLSALEKGIESSERVTKREQKLSDRFRAASPFMSPLLTPSRPAMMSYYSSPALLAKRKSDKSNKNDAKLFDRAHSAEMSSRQWAIFSMYCWGFFALGVFTSVPGPILPTLMEQVDVSLASISFIFSARAVGFVVGSVISGYVMDAYQKHLISEANGTAFLLRRNQRIADYLWSLPRCSYWPMSAHNVWTLSLLIAAATNAAIPYVRDVYALALLVVVNGVCFGTINTFGNVLLLTLFDVEVAGDIDFDAIYDNNTNLDSDEHEMIDQSDSELIIAHRDPEQWMSPLCDSAASQRSTTARPIGNIGPFMQALQAFYALGGLLAVCF